MKKNVGNLDKGIRIILAVVFAALFFTKIVTGVLGTVLLVLAAIFVLTSVVGICPIYSVLGMSTCPVKGQKS